MNLKLPFSLEGCDLPVYLPLDLQVSVLTVAIYKKLHFAFNRGVDLPVGLPLVLQGISSHNRNL